MPPRSAIHDVEDSNSRHAVFTPQLWLARRAAGVLGSDVEHLLGRKFRLRGSFSDECRTKLKHVHPVMIASPHHLKILWSIIEFVSVDVVDMLSALRRAAQFIRDDQPRSLYVASIRGVWMGRCVDVGVSAINRQPSLPSMMFIALRSARVVVALGVGVPLVSSLSPLDVLSTAALTERWA